MTSHVCTQLCVHMSYVSLRFDNVCNFLWVWMCYMLVKRKKMQVRLSEYGSVWSVWLMWVSYVCIYILSVPLSVSIYGMQLYVTNVRHCSFFVCMHNFAAYAYLICTQCMYVLCVSVYGMRISNYACMWGCIYVWICEPVWTCAFCATGTAY